MAPALAAGERAMAGTGGSGERRGAKTDALRDEGSVQGAARTRDQAGGRVGTAAWILGDGGGAEVAGRGENAESATMSH